MMRLPLRLGLALTGDDPKLRQLVTYWGMTVLIYLLCTAILWGEVFFGAANARAASALTALAILGQALFYGLIRFSQALSLSPAWLSECQGRFAIICTVSTYAIIGPFRAATLLLLLVILVFCTFTLEPRRTYSLALFGVAFLGLVMLWMVHWDPDTFDATTEIKHFILASAMVAVVGFLTGRMSELRATLKTQKRELTEALHRIQELATRDVLTALPNRRFMTEHLKSEQCNLAARNGSACLALLDLDWFKKINDTYGHAVGDEVLCEVAKEGKLVLRADDVFARWGGEEFLLYLPDSTLEVAKAVVERLKARVSSRRFVHNNEEFGVSFSAGLVELLPEESMDCGIGRADALLYAAKAEGRDRIVTCQPTPSGRPPTK